MVNGVLNPFVANDGAVWSLTYRSEILRGLHGGILFEVGVEGSGITDCGKTLFINVFPAMLGEDGKPKPDIFLKDNLHMNAKGYAIWVPIVRPYLKK